MHEFLQFYLIKLVGVYTEVSAYVLWINEKLAALNKKNTVRFVDSNL